MEIWITAMFAIVSALSGLIVWFLQKNRERKDKLLHQKQLLYESLLLSMVDLYSGNIAPIFVEAQLAWLYASDDLLKLLNSFFLSRAQNDKSHTELQKIIGYILLEMREDIIKDTKISREWTDENFVALTANEELVAKYIKLRFERFK